MEQQIIQQPDLEIYDELQQEELQQEELVQPEQIQIVKKLTTKIPTDKIILDAIEGEFNKSIRIENDKEAKELKRLIGLFIKKKRDYKFIIQPNYNTLFELATEFCTKIIPILKYLIIRLSEQGFAKYRDRIINILASVETDKINHYYNRLNGSFYGKTILYNKLYMILEKNEKKLHSILLLVYALLPFKEKPVKPGTVGIPEHEYEEMYSEE